MKRAAALILALVLCLGLCSLTAMAEETGTVTVAVDGTYAAADITAVLTRVNEIRKEAYDEGLVDSYVEVTWSSGLEEIAQLRAAEACLNWAHTRPNGETCFTVTASDGTSSWAENLAQSAMLYAIEMFYSEKDDYVAGTEGAVTGHYTNMINPSYNSIGMGTFTASNGGTRTAMEFGYAAGDGASTGVSGSTTVSIEVTASGLSVSGTSALTVGDESTLAVTATYNGTAYSVVDDITWTSSDEAVATVDENGIVTAVGAGSATITATVGTLSGTLDVTVTEVVETAEPTATQPAVTGTEPTETPAATDTSATETPVSTDSSSGGTTVTVTVAPTADAARSPETGDDANTGLWIALIALCAIGSAAVIMTLRKKAE
ncbi:MAG: CAP domain-containing protein [Oscillospiraceae bacterium]|nr:CAP domain-containing protein [Oscillospiraceae bacterium]